MIAGPRTRLLTTSAPASITTRPSIDEVASTEPSIRGSSVSSTRRLHSSSGSFLPVSIHQPSSTSWWTRWPWSISHWMASVISSSPRHDGSMARPPRGSPVEQVDAHQGEVRRRVGRLLDQAHDLAVVGELGHAELARSATLAEQDLGDRGSGRTPRPGGEAAGALLRLEPLDEVGESPAGACCRPGT